MNNKFTNKIKNVKIIKKECFFHDARLKEKKKNLAKCDDFVDLKFIFIFAHYNFFENRNSGFNRSSNFISSKFYFKFINLILNIFKITFIKIMILNLFKSHDNTHIKQLFTFLFQ